MHAKWHFSHVQLFVTFWIGVHQAPQFMEFSRQEYWSGLPCLPPGDLPNPGIEPVFPATPALQTHSFTTESPLYTGTLFEADSFKKHFPWEISDIHKNEENTVIMNPGVPIPPFQQLTTQTLPWFIRSHLPTLGYFDANFRHHFILEYFWTYLLRVRILLPSITIMPTVKVEHRVTMKHPLIPDCF